MTIGWIIYLSVMGFTLGVCIYFLIRNNWVYSARISLLNEDIKLYYSLPSYKQMMYKYFYIWDKNWFVKSIRKNSENNVKEN